MKNSDENLDCNLGTVLNHAFFTRPKRVSLSTSSVRLLEKKIELYGKQPLGFVLEFPGLPIILFSIFFNVLADSLDRKFSDHPEKIDLACFSTCHIR